MSANSIFARRLVVLAALCCSSFVSGQATAPAEAVPFRVPDGLRANLFASAPLVIHPVAIDVDRFGRLWVAETFRQETRGVPDNRSHRQWIPDDLRAQSVEDRRKMYLKHYPDIAAKWATHEDRVSLLEDDDGDGIADRSRVWAGGFQDLLDGTGAGLLHVDGEVFFTCIPHLWRLSDRDGDGLAESREALHSGYGVRVALRGHDLHGLIRGPDDRLWFSIGDRGYHIELEDGRVLHAPDSGAVFRCELDGSDLQVMHTGLRNPQELAFDDLGELWTVDNNSDAGDRARLIHLIPGGDAGWRMNYQYRPDRGPWMPEGWWKPRHDPQPAFLNAPLANIARGPSGLLHDPGLELPEKWRGRFLVCDFVGSSRHSNLLAFDVEPEGAGFKLSYQEVMLAGVLATDVAAGPDGALWISDWVHGWVGEGKGRIWRVEPTDPAAKARALEVQQLLASDFDLMPSAKLGALLGHRDRRIRLQAQWALGRKTRGGFATLAQVARSSGPRLARIHALWGLGVVARRTDHSLAAFIPLLGDPDAEIRAQTARVFCDTAYADARAALLPTLEDQEPRVRAFAASALGQVGKPEDVAALLTVARENDDRDPVLRHHVVLGLQGIAERSERVTELLAAASDPSPAVRRALVLALRRLGNTRVARFLDDPDESIATEAAIAIHDVPINGGLSRLAELLNDDRPRTPFFLRRALSACDLLSNARHAQSLATFAANSEAPTVLRAAAIEALAEWGEKPEFDRVLNRWRPRPPRTAEDASRALVPVLPAILRAAPSGLVPAAARAARVFKCEDAVAPLADIARDEEGNLRARLAALAALRKLYTTGLDDLAADLLKSRHARIRGAAVEALVDVKPDAALAVIGRALREGSLFERQLGLVGLGRMADPRADQMLQESAKRAIAGNFPRGAWIELLENTDLRREANPELGGLGDSLRAQIAALNDPLGERILSLEGGLPERGREIFFENAAVSCQRCHAVGQDAHTDRTGLAGPSLDGVAKRRSRHELALSIVDPNAQIADGYENLLIETMEGDVYRGRMLSESETAIVLEVLEAGEPEAVEIARSSIETKTSEASSMPADLADKLSLRELRDLVAWLATLEELPPAPESPETPEKKGK